MIDGVKLAPSILSADFTKLGEQIFRVESAGADYIHVDVMDGRFVPVISMGTPLLESIRSVTGLTLDIHLMIDEPESHVDSFIKSGGDIINVHIEATDHISEIIDLVKSNDRKVGVCINPETPVSTIESIIPDLDQIMVMSVNPGWSGQQFIESSLDKVTYLRELIDDRGLRVDIEIDGGVRPGNILECRKAGANVIVASSAIFNNTSTIEDNMEQLKASLA